MKVSYECVALACEKNDQGEGEDLSIDCGSGKTISIIDAAYGRSDRVTCPKEGAMSKQDCKASNSVVKVREICQGKSACKIPTGEGNPFGDPCSGTYKYLKVSYGCA